MLSYVVNMYFQFLWCICFTDSENRTMDGFYLKVGGNEKNGGSGRSQMLDNGLGPWRSRFIFNLNVQFLSKMSYFRFRL
jgi:hypothetical protein